MAILIRAENLHKSMGPRTLFDGLALTVHDDDRLGLIGPNGAGKSTLLKCIAGVLPVDGGTIQLQNDARVAYLPQVDDFPEEATVEGALLEALDADHAAAHAAGAPPMEAHERTTRARVMLGKLGFEDGAQLARTLSGGWRKRLAIGCRLVLEPDVLLLDEPTNHLDLAGIAWLEGLLAKPPCAVVLVSHDRYLLEAVCTRVIEINPKYPDGYFHAGGCYSEFLERREAWLESESRREERLANLVRQDIEWLRRGPQGRRSKNRGRIAEAQGRITQLAETKNRTGGADAASLDFSASGRRSRDLIVAEGVAKTMGETPLFRGIETVCSPGTRLGLVGNNGSGKTTLLRVLTKDLEPDKGAVRHAGGLRVVVFDQRREGLDPEATLRRTLAPNGDQFEVEGRTVHVVGWAQRFLFRPDQLDVPVGQLSGGEQARALLAMMMKLPADVLVLDEPTNDLDIPTIEVLEEALSQFAGAVLLVTHDRFLLDRLATDVIGLHGEGEARPYGSLEQWQRREEQLLAERRRRAKKEKDARRAANAASAAIDPATGAAPVMPSPSAGPGLGSRGASGTSGAGRGRGLSREENREFNRMEETILKAESALEELHERLNDPDLASDHEALRTLGEEAHAAQEQVEALYARWEELERIRLGDA